MVAAIAIAERGDIVCQRVYPDIDDMLGVECDRDAPFERGARHAQILKPRLDEVVDHLVHAALRLHKLGVVLIELEDAVAESRQLEKVSFLLCVGNFAPAVGALAIDQLAVRPERFARRAVFALIGTFVNIAFIVQVLKDFLDRFDVVVIRCTHEPVV